MSSWHGVSGYFNCLAAYLSLLISTSRFSSLAELYPLLSLPSQSSSSSSARSSPSSLCDVRRALLYAAALTRAIDALINADKWSDVSPSPIADATTPADAATGNDTLTVPTTSITPPTITRAECDLLIKHACNLCCQLYEFGINVNEMIIKSYQLAMKEERQDDAATAATSVSLTPTPHPDIPASSMSISPSSPSPSSPSPSPSPAIVYAWLSSQRWARGARILTVAEVILGVKQAKRKKETVAEMEMEQQRGHEQQERHDHDHEHGHGSDDEEDTEKGVETEIGVDAEMHTEIEDQKEGQTPTNQNNGEASHSKLMEDRTASGAAQDGDR